MKRGGRAAPRALPQIGDAAVDTLVGFIVVVVNVVVVLALGRH